MEKITIEKAPGWLSDAPLADVVPRSETCPYYVHNEHDRGNDGLCRKAGCEVEAVQRVVYGEWIWEEPNSANRFRGCFLCNKCFESVYAKKNYCPNCGADMRGEEDDKM